MKKHPDIFKSNAVYTFYAIFYPCLPAFREYEPRAITSQRVGNKGASVRETQPTNHIISVPTRPTEHKFNKMSTRPRGRCLCACPSLITSRRRAEEKKLLSQQAAHAHLYFIGWFAHETHQANIQRHTLMAPSWIFQNASSILLFPMYEANADLVSNNLPMGSCSAQSIQRLIE